MAGCLRPLPASLPDPTHPAPPRSASRSTLAPPPPLRRENTEGEYSGLEHEVVPGVVESLKVRSGLKAPALWQRGAVLCRARGVRLGASSPVSVERQQANSGTGGRVLPEVLLPTDGGTLPNGR